MTSFKDYDTLIELERVCGWQASTALLEIAGDEECLQTLAELELVQAAVEATPEPARAPPQSLARRSLDVALAASVIFVMLASLPGAAGGGSLWITLVVALVSGTIATSMTSRAGWS